MLAEDNVVPVQIGAKEFRMTPSLDACERVSAMSGGLDNVIRQIQSLDFSVICKVLEIGCGFNPTQGKLLKEEVYKHGILYLQGPCIAFVHTVARGGKVYVAEEEDADEGDSPLAGSA